MLCAPSDTVEFPIGKELRSACIIMRIKVYILEARVVDVVEITLYRYPVISLIYIQLLLPR